jgi:hypothetical protein
MAIPVSSTTLAAYILEGPYFAIVIGQWVRVLHTVSHFSSAIVKVDRGCIDTIQSFSRVPHARSPSEIAASTQQPVPTFYSDGEATLLVFLERGKWKAELLPGALNIVLQMRTRIKQSSESRRS